MKDPYSDLPYIHPLNKLPAVPSMLGPSCIHCRGKHLGVDCIYRPKKNNENHDFNNFTTSEDAKLINNLLKEKMLVAITEVFTATVNASNIDYFLWQI